MSSQYSGVSAKSSLAPKIPSTLGLRPSPAGYFREEVFAVDKDLGISALVHDVDPALNQGRVSTILADRLDNTILVTGLLLSPIYSATNMHGVAGNPALCMITYLACLLDACGLLISVGYRVRLRALKSRDLDEQYAQKLCGSQFGSFLSIMSPLVLLASAVVLFLVSLSGSLLSSVDTSEMFEAALGIPQLAMLTVGLSFLFIQGRLVFRASTI